MSGQRNQVVHLELHTPNLPRAVSFYTRLLGWDAERVSLGAGSYQAVELGERIAGGIVEHETGQALWLPYVRVCNVAEATERASELGAEVKLAPREGPAGWRSVIASPDAAAVALWQPKQGGR